jgi:hypothetical protein
LRVCTGWNRIEPGIHPVRARRRCAGEVRSRGQAGLPAERGDECARGVAAHPLWAQIIVRGFWHPTGHLGDYYISRGLAGRAVALHAQARDTARYLHAPGLARAMASYSLACAQSLAGQPDEAVASLAGSIELNPDLRANAGRDSDLTALRDSGRLAPLLASR